jgi:hypothetical protein
LHASQIDAASLFRMATEFAVEFDPDVPCVVMRWCGYHTSAAFRANNEQALALIAARGASRLLCDVRTFLLIGASDQEWLIVDWLPRAIAAGLAAAALVTPLFHFNRVAVDAVLRRLPSDAMQVACFDTTADARAWLRALG